MKKLTFSFGETPNEAIEARLPESYDLNEAVAHFEDATGGQVAQLIEEVNGERPNVFTRFFREISGLSNQNFNVDTTPSGMVQFMDKLYNNGSDEALILRACILDTINIREF